jgi:CheY-like chemotaxis protein
MGEWIKGDPPIALVVDDYRDAAESLARLLQTLGCRANFVTDASSALEVALASHANVVFIDIGMPKINGFELATLFRACFGESVRLVAATAYGGTAVQARCRDAGFNCSLQKPVHVAALERTLELVFCKT